LITSGRILSSLCIQFVSFAIADFMYVESTLVQFQWTGLGDAVEQGKNFWLSEKMKTAHHFN
jgi:hypothetical protein